MGGGARGTVGVRGDGRRASRGPWGGELTGGEPPGAVGK